VQDDDAGLLEAWAAGDGAAGNVLYRRYADALVRFFRNKVAGDLEDLVQQTLLRSLEGRARWRGAGTFRSYLFGIAYRVLSDHYRGKYSGPAQVDVGDSSIHDLSPGPSVLLAQRREHQLLLDALRRIPASYQVVLELYYWEGMTSAEIAAALDIPHGTAQTRLRRAKELLAAQVEPHAREVGGARSLAEALDEWAASVRATAGAWPRR
jgi:RNA polymerase sigma-70 factor, ECF subfamily